jgi:hypothetical protein
MNTIHMDCIDFVAGGGAVAAGHALRTHTGMFSNHEMFS